MARKRAATTPASALAAISKWRRRMRWIRRLVVVATMISTVHRATRTFRGTRPRPTGAPGPRPTTLATLATPVTVTATTVTVSPAEPADASEVGPPTWVESTSPDAPEGYPVKVNARSGIFHEPGSAFYDRTRADRWYRTAADAEADGFRAAKSV